MNLSAAISRLTPCWEIVLSQIGLPYIELDKSSPLSPDNHPVVVLSTNTYLPQSSVVDYLNSGGCVITEADIAKKFFNIKTQRRYLEYILSNIEVFNIEGICDIYKASEVPLQGNHLPDQSGINTSLITPAGKGCLFVLPSGFVDLLADERIKRKNFYSPYAKKETNERVSAVSKGMITNIIRAGFEYLYHFRNLPYITLWQYPGGAENIFSFRIDTDFASQKDINNLYSILINHGIKGTWFIETRSAEPFLADFKTFRNQEISLHCYRHRVFRTYNKNKEQIKKGIELLTSNDLSPSGFAAPYGQWNNNLGTAINESDFQYSSEFGYAYDSLPLYPVLNDEFSRVLQVPVHPLSLGRLHWGGHSPDEMILYFDFIYQNKLAAYEPLNIYAHPSELKFNVLNDVLANAAALNLPYYTYGEISHWWKKRILFKWGAAIMDNSLKLELSVPGEDFWIKVSEPNKNVYLTPAGEDFNKKIKFLKSAEVKLSSFSLKELRTRSLRMFYHDYLSAYRKLKQ